MSGSILVNMSVSHSPPPIKGDRQCGGNESITENNEANRNLPGMSESANAALGGGDVPPPLGAGSSTPNATSAHRKVTDEKDLFGSNDTLTNDSINSSIKNQTQIRQTHERVRANSMGDIASVIDRENLRRTAMNVRKRQRQDESGGTSENESEDKYEWLEKWDENNLKIESVDKDMKDNFKLLFERMDRENEMRRKEFDLFREENKLREEMLKQENLMRREKEWDERLQCMQKQIDEMKLAIERMRKEDAQCRINEKENFRANENNYSQQGQSSSQGGETSVGMACMEKVKGIEMWMDRKEREEKENNFVISGWVKEGTINKKEVHEFLIEKLGYAGALERISEVREIRAIKGRLIWVRMHDWNEKDWIMKNKSKLKGPSNERIFIDNDRTRKQKEMQKVINQTAQRLREEGNENVKVRFGRLENNGVWYKWDAWKECLVVAKNDQRAYRGNN